MKCIYCLKDKDESQFRKVEHVIPQSFGLFEDNLTLKGIVCDECNQYFGDYLEINLARDSIEGLLRFMYGYKNKEDYKSMGKRSKLIFKLASEGTYKNAFAYLEYSDSEADVTPKPLPQIGFRKNPKSDYIYYPMENIPSKQELIDQGYALDEPRSFIIVSSDTEEAVKLLKEKGIELKHNEALEENLISQEPEIDVQRAFDDILQRAIAKISFNYLSYWEKEDFAYNNSFNDVRNFILKGTRTSYPMISYDTESILADEKSLTHSRDGHIITVNWTADGVSIVGQVSLYNLLRYKVTLARKFIGEKRKIKRGHFFNVCDKRIYPMG